MVEHSHLWFGPWIADPSAGRVRLIRDSQHDTTIGIVRFTSLSDFSWWRFWPRAEGLEICETDDRALLMSIRPSRMKKGVWIVRDCDDNEVGKLRGEELLDPWSQPFARRYFTGEGSWQMREFDGRIYATWTMCDGGGVLAFRENEITNPFVRMLIVASFILPERIA